MPEVYTLEAFAHRVSIVKYVGALNVLFVVLLLTIVWLNMPDKIDYRKDRPVKGYAYARLLANVAVAFIPLFLFAYNLIFLK